MLATCVAEIYSWGTDLQSLTLTVSPVSGSPGKFLIRHNVQTLDEYTKLYFCGTPGAVMQLPATGSVVTVPTEGPVQAQIVLTDIYAELVNTSNVVYFQNTGAPPGPSAPYFDPTDPGSYGVAGGQVSQQIPKQLNQEYEAATYVTLQVFKDLESEPFFSASLVPGDTFVPLRLPGVGQAKSLQVRVYSSGLRCPVSLARMEVTIGRQRRAGQ